MTIPNKCTQFYTSCTVNELEGSFHITGSFDKKAFCRVNSVNFLEKFSRQGSNLERNPFDGKDDDSTPDYIWQMIAAYCRTYGLKTSIGFADERLENIYFKDDDTRRLGPVVRLSRDELKRRSDYLARRTDVFDRPIYLLQELVNYSDKENDAVSPRKSG